MGTEWESKPNPTHRQTRGLTALHNQHLRLSLVEEHPKLEYFPKGISSLRIARQSPLSQRLVFGFLDTSWDSMFAFPKTTCNPFCEWTSGMFGSSGHSTIKTIVSERSTFAREKDCASKYLRPRDNNPCNYTRRFSYNQCCSDPSLRREIAELPFC